MYTGQLVQNHAQVLRAPGNFHAHERFDGLGTAGEVTRSYKCRKCVLQHR